MFAVDLTDSFVQRNTESGGDSFNFAFQDNIYFLEDRLIVTVGARYDWGRDEGTFNVLTGVGGRTTTDTNWSTKYGVVFKPIKGKGISLFYQDGETFNFQSGEDDFGTPLDNQIGKTDEFGIKLDMFNHRLVATLSYFENSLTNLLEQQFIDRDGDGIPEPTSKVGGASSTEGWEIDATWAPTDAINFIVGITDLDSVDEDGVRFRNIPQNVSWSALGKYSFNKGPLEGLSFGLGYQYKNEGAGDRGDTYTRPAYDVFDAFVAYRRDNWKFQVNVENLTDNDDLVAAITRWRAIPLAPRMARIRVGYEF